jgi:hypothetical protein
VLYLDFSKVFDLIASDFTEQEDLILLLYAG